MGFNINNVRFPFLLQFFAIYYAGKKYPQGYIALRGWIHADNEAISSVSWLGGGFFNDLQHLFIGGEFKLLQPQFTGFSLFQRL